MSLWLVVSDIPPIGATVLDEILYAITVDDLRIVYDDFHSEGAWDSLHPSKREALIDGAKGIDFSINWYDEMADYLETAS